MDDESGGSNEGNSSVLLEKSPLWGYVTIVRKADTGGNCTWKCKLCHAQKQGSYTRVKAHFFKESGHGVSGCSKMTVAMRSTMVELLRDSETKAASNAPKEVPLASGPSISTTDPSILKKRKGSNTIAGAFDMQARDELDCEIARMFYTGGVSFNLARNPHFIKSYKLAADKLLTGYVPPGFNKIRTTLLDQERAHVETLLQPIKNSWPSKGITIVSDGWSDPQRRPLINVMVVSGGGPMFMKSENCAGEFKGKEFIADLLKSVIDEVGHQNVVQIITDNASNCKAAGELIEGIYPHIYWTPCVVHTLNLALKNICAPKDVASNKEVYILCHWIIDVYDTAMQIKNFIMNHGMRLSMFNKFSPIKLLSVADTRFASIVIMLKRFKLIRRALESMVMSDEWTLYKDDDQAKAKFVRDTVINDDWWEKLIYIVEFTAPVYDMIRACDTDKACLHLVYEMWDCMIEKVKKVIYKKEGIDLSDISVFYDAVNSILQSHWLKANTPLHCLAHSLNPRYYSDTWLLEDSSRVAPHRDAEVSTERLKCFRRLFPDVDVCRRVISEYASFSLKSGQFSDLVSVSMMDDEDPRVWWASFGAPIPLLQELAFKLLGQPTSSSCCERNWSTYAFIHSMKRNRLNPGRAEDLVYIHNNLRLLSRSTAQYKDPTSKMWDVGGDAFGSVENSSMLDFAELSLDEPDLEEDFILREED